jgi:hypothetical protein
MYNMLGIDACWLEMSCPVRWRTSDPIRRNTWPTCPSSCTTTMLSRPTLCGWLPQTMPYLTPSLMTALSSGSAGTMKLNRGLFCSLIRHGEKNCLDWRSLLVCVTQQRLLPACDGLIHLCICMKACFSRDVFMRRSCWET